MAFIGRIILFAIIRRLVRVVMARTASRGKGTNLIAGAALGIAERAITGKVGAGRRPAALSRLSRS